MEKEKGRSRNVEIEKAILEASYELLRKLSNEIV